MTRDALFTSEYRDLLLRLLAIPTVSSLEAAPEDPPARHWEAQRTYADAARSAGMEVIHHAPAPPEALYREDVPSALRRAAADPEFLNLQPSLVLRLGPELPRADTVMFNVHLDTVSGSEPVKAHRGRITGRARSTPRDPLPPCSRGSTTRRTGNPPSGAGSASSSKPFPVRKAAPWAASGPGR